MSDLINELHQEHSIIIHMLNKVKELGVTSQEGQTLLVSAKEDLLKHLQKEDNKLYPVLRREAENNKGLKSMLDIFAADMDKLSKAAVDYFEKYSQGGSGREFFKDTLSLVTSLKERIGKEERMLYEEYNKLNQ